MLQFSLLQYVEGTIVENVVSWFVAAVQIIRWIWAKAKNECVSCASKYVVP